MTRTVERIKKKAEKQVLQKTMRKHRKELAREHNRIYEEESKKVSPEVARFKLSNDIAHLPAETPRPEKKTITLAQAFQFAVGN